MRYRIPSEVAIMFAAQNAVDQWLRAVRRPPFQRAVDTEEERIWDGHAGYERERTVFHALADAIRVGKGHAWSNPGPLLKLAARIRGRQEP